MERFISVDVYGSLDRAGRGIDCTNNGVSVTCRGELYVAAPDGNYTRDDLNRFIEEGRNVCVLELTKRNVMGNDYYHMRPEGDDRWLMMGGNFAYTSDSRFPFKYPVPIHDRHEG